MVNNLGEEADREHRASLGAHTGKSTYSCGYRGGGAGGVG